MDSCARDYIYVIVFGDLAPQTLPFCATCTRLYAFAYLQQEQCICLTVRQTLVRARTLFRSPYARLNRSVTSPSNCACATVFYGKTNAEQPLCLATQLAPCRLPLCSTLVPEEKCTVQITRDCRTSAPPHYRSCEEKRGDSTLPPVLLGGVAWTHCPRVVALTSSGGACQDDATPLKHAARGTYISHPNFTFLQQQTKSLFQLTPNLLYSHPTTLTHSKW